MSTTETCRDCALPWVGVPCGNCGCSEPAPQVPAVASEPESPVPTAEPPAPVDELPQPPAKSRRRAKAGS